eukprot:scaffold32502_cov44-Attheya_sp.AAC.2
MGRFAVQEEDDEQDDQHGNHDDTSTPRRGTIPDAWRSATWSTPSRFSLARAEEPAAVPETTRSMVGGGLFHSSSSAAAEESHHHRHPIEWLSEEEEEVGGTPFSALVGVNFWKTPPTNHNANDGTDDHHPHTSDGLDHNSEEAEDNFTRTMSHHEMDQNPTNDGGQLWSDVLVRPATGTLYDNENHDYDVGLLSGTNHMRKPSSFFRKRNVMILIVFLAVAIKRYAPNPPILDENESIVMGYGDQPPVTWNQYCASTIYNAVSLADQILYLSWYVLSGTLSNAFHDWTESMTKRIRKPCPIQLPNSLHDILAAKEFMGFHLVGQDLAVEEMMNALDAWDPKDTPTSSSIHNNHNHINNRPLILILSGLDGVGKTHAARLLSEWIFRDCKQPQHRDKNIARDRLLIIHGEDYHTDRMANNNHITRNENDGNGPTTSVSRGVSQHVPQDQNSFMTAIAAHVKKQQGAGGVIILEHFDAISPSLIRPLLRALQGSDPITLPGSSFQDDSIRLDFDNMIFIFTTNKVGTHEILEVMHRRQGEISNRALHYPLRSAMDAHFGPDVPLLVQHVNAFVPFVPLGQVELVEILQRMVHLWSEERAGQQWDRLLFTDRALSYIVSPPHVEYVDSRSTRWAFSFVKMGAHALLRSSSSSSSSSSRQQHAIVIVQELKSMVKQHLIRTAAQPDKNATLDYDEASSDLTLSWCTTTNNNHANQDTQEVVDSPAGTGTSSSCIEVWRGPLVN